MAPVSNANQPARSRPAKMAEQLTPKKPVPTRQRPVGSCGQVAARKKAQARKRLADRKAGKGGLPGGTAIVKDIMIGHGGLAMIAVLMQAFSNSISGIGRSIGGAIVAAFTKSEARQDVAPATPAPATLGDLMPRPLARVADIETRKKPRRRLAVGDDGTAGGDGVSTQAAAKQAMAAATMPTGRGPKPGGGAGNAPDPEPARPAGRYPADEVENQAMANAARVYGDPAPMAFLP